MDTTVCAMAQWQRSSSQSSSERLHSGPVSANFHQACRWRSDALSGKLGKLQDEQNIVDQSVSRLLNALALGVRSWEQNPAKLCLT